MKSELPSLDRFFRFRIFPGISSSDRNLRMPAVFALAFHKRVPFFIAIVCLAQSGHFSGRTASASAYIMLIHPV